MDNNKKKKVIIISVIATLLLVLLIGGTIAYFGWSGDESLVDVTVSSGTGSCTKLSDNNILLEPTSTKEKGRILKMTAKQEMADKAYITWDLVVNTISGLQDKTFVYELVNTTIGTVYTSSGTGNFENVASGDTITFSSDELLDYNTDYEFTLYLWIDGTIGNNPLTMADQVFDFDISCNITGADISQ